MLQLHLTLSKPHSPHLRKWNTRLSFSVLRHLGLLSVSRGFLLGSTQAQGNQVFCPRLSLTCHQNPRTGKEKPAADLEGNRGC